MLLNGQRRSEEFKVYEWTPRGLMFMSFKVVSDAIPQEITLKGLNPHSPGQNPGKT